jgi:hypothetical protein
MRAKLEEQLRKSLATGKPPPEHPGGFLQTTSKWQSRWSRMLARRPVPGTS